MNFFHVFLIIKNSQKNKKMSLDCLLQTRLVSKIIKKLKNFVCKITFWNKRSNRIYVLVLSDLMSNATYFRCIRSKRDQMNTQLLILHGIPIITPPSMECNSAMFGAILQHYCARFNFEYVLKCYRCQFSDVTIQIDIQV